MGSTVRFLSRRRHEEGIVVKPLRPRHNRSAPPTPAEPKRPLLRNLEKKQRLFSAARQVGVADPKNMQHAI